jgi:hypothetical protein
VTTPSLTPRTGRSLPSGGPYEGAPRHLRDGLRHWFEDLFTGIDDFTGRTTYDNGPMLSFVAAARIELRGAPRDQYLLDQILREAGSSDPEELLDLIHYALQVAGTRYGINKLNQLLVDGDSVWTATQDGLERRVALSAQGAYDAVTSPRDVASDELEEAWSNTFRRHPDPSDAWDHAIKAIEAILIPIVVPNQAKPTLGHVVSHLDKQSQHWKLVLPGPNNDYSVQPLVAMLRLIWPNPDRHGSPQHRRAPTRQEAQAVVHLAVTIVQWGRDGQIVKR